jgi:hypothetical protein
LRAIWHAAALLGWPLAGRKEVKRPIAALAHTEEQRLGERYKRRGAWLAAAGRENIGERCTKRGTLHRTLHANGGAVEITLNAGTL